jgi:Transglutaminase-like superfamily
VLIAIESVVTLAWVRLLLRVAPRRALRGVLEQGGEGRPADPRVAAIFRRTMARVPFAHNCMHRSLALQRMLARRGTSAQLRIGLGAKPDLFPGHAWLEWGGAVINDDPELVRRYAPLVITQSALEVTYQ